MPLFALVCLLAAQRAACQREVNDLQENLPVRIADATPSRGLEFQGMGRYVRTDSGEDSGRFSPQIQYGWGEHWQLQIQSTILAGPAGRTGSGDIEVELMRRVNRERRYLPAFALALQGTAPSGKDSAGLDTRVHWIASKSLTGDSSTRVHFNAAWYHNSGRQATERKSQYELVAGFSRLLNDSTSVVADYVRVQERERGQDANIVEGGIRRQIGGKVIVSAGVGGGIGAQSPAVRVTAGIEISIQ